MISALLNNVDVSNYVLKMPDFDIFFSNFDMSLKLPTVTVEISHLVTPLKGQSFKIWDGEILLFPGYVKLVRHNEQTKKYTLTIASVLEKLKDTKIDEVLHKSYADAAVYQTDTGDGGTGILSYFHNYHCFNVPSDIGLIQWIFESFTGYGIFVKYNAYVSEPSLTLGANNKIINEFLWNAGCEIISGNPALRDNANLASWFDLVDLIFRCGLLLSWDAVNARFIITSVYDALDFTYPTTYKYSLPADNAIYKETVQYLTFDKSGTTAGSWHIGSSTSGTDYYFDRYVSSTYNAEVNTSPKESSAKNGYAIPVVNNIVRQPNAIGPIYDVQGLYNDFIIRRSSESEMKLIKIETDILYDVSYTNISIARQVFRSGKYYTEIEMITEE